MQAIDRNSSTAEVLAWVHPMPDVAPYAELVGRWVWVRFPAKPSPETIAALKSAGFRWVARRGAWAHACGIRSARSRHDPRSTYGAIPAESLEVSQ